MKEIKKKIKLSLNISGGIMLFIIIIGAFLNAYGLNIKIGDLLIFGTPVFITTLLILIFSKKSL